MKKGRLFKKKKKEKKTNAANASRVESDVKIQEKQIIITEKQNNTTQKHTVVQFFLIY